MDDNVMDFMAYKGKAMMPVAGQHGETVLFDLDAWLAERGVDRATINAIFADHVTNEEEQAPLVAQRQKELEKHRNFMRFLQQWMPQDQAQHAWQNSTTESTFPPFFGGKFCLPVRGATSLF
jgi:hypothetical protein